MSTTSPSPSSSTSGARYVALGDSYTIGTSVTSAERFPNQLVDRLRGTVDLELVANLGVNGYTSANLIDRELPALAGLEPDFVTLLIGVNDVVQGVPLEAYRANVRLILDELLARLPADRIVVVSIPDYTRTPSGGLFGDPVQQRAGIAAANAAMADEAVARGISFVDISAVADAAATDRTLVADDALHPSGAQYAGWVELIAPVVEGLFAPGA
ncbi:MAG TPA: SGNH/GDSL hydrolase family protein [Candidatus Limnocylindrales bacterium]